jgi:hypothetical protein
MGSSSQQPVTQQTTQTKDPWGPAQEYLRNTMGQANALMAGNIGYNPFPGNTTAPIGNQYTAPAMARVDWLANQEPFGSAGVQDASAFLANLVTNQGLNTGLQTAAGQFGDIYSRALGNENPYLQGVINQQMNKVNSAMSGSGRYGSGAHDAAIAQAIAPTLAQDYLARQNLQMQATGAMGDIYSQGLQRAGQATQAIPALDEARYASAAHLMDLGQQQRSYEQALLDQQLKFYNATQAFPWENLSRGMGIFGQAGGLGGTQITASPGAMQPSTLQRVLGGGLAGAGLGSAIFPGVGTGVGAAAGGLLGLL